MALRNAFENLGTENALRRIANLLTFARTSSDQIRAVVDSGTVTSNVYNRTTTVAQQNDPSPTWYNNNTWNMIDAREPLKTSINAAAADARSRRWTVT
jgi:hypothetical protein